MMITAIAIILAVIFLGMLLRIARELENIAESLDNVYGEAHEIDRSLTSIRDELREIGDSENDQEHKG